MGAASRSMAVRYAALYCSETGGYAGLAGGDGFAVLSAVGVLWEFLGVVLDLAGVGFSVAGVGGYGEHGDVGGRGVHDEADCPAAKVLVS